MDDDFPTSAGISRGAFALAAAAISRLHGICSPGDARLRRAAVRCGCCAPEIRSAAALRKDRRRANEV
jgi:hypothetical protein